jgi:alkylhydroperoxidase/carboxymuconolactone decarboxylase family protein YurZ
MPKSSTEALLRIAALVSVAPDGTSFPWAVDLALASGVDDEQVFQALIVVAPIVGQAKISSSLPHLMDALELEVLEG